MAEGVREGMRVQRKREKWVRRESVCGEKGEQRKKIAAGKNQSIKSDANEWGGGVENTSGLWKKGGQTKLSHSTHPPLPLFHTPTCHNSFKFKILRRVRSVSADNSSTP